MDVPDDFLHQVIQLFVYPVLGALALAIVAFLTNLSRRWVNDQATEQRRGLVEDAIKNGLNYALQQVGADDIKKQDVQDGIVARTYIYVDEHTDARDLKSAGLDLSTSTGQVILKEKIKSRMAPLILAAEAAPSRMTVAEVATLLNPAIPTAPINVTKP